MQNVFVSPYRLKSIEIYKLLLRAGPILMPTHTARTFWINRVKKEFRRNRHETNIKKIEEHLYRAYNILKAASKE